MNNKGVTLIEICLVGVILSILFTVVWPVMNRIARSSQLETTCDKLSCLFRCARDYALSESKYYCVQFDTAMRQYWLAVREERASSSYSFAPLTDSLHKKTHWPEEIQLANISRQQVIFYPDGTSQDFEIVFKNIHGNICKLKLQGSLGKITISDETSPHFMPH